MTGLFIGNHRRRMTDADETKAEVIRQTQSPALAEALGRWPAAYFLVAAETCADPEDREDLLSRLVELFRDATEQQTRRADAATAKLADARRHGLRIVTEPQQRRHRA